MREARIPEQAEAMKNKDKNRKIVEKIREKIADVAI